jgi:hypothetical protein
MALHITPEIVCHAYELLRATPPFKRWKLPPSDDIEVQIVTAKEYVGEVTTGLEHIKLRISLQHVGSLNNLLYTLAHEMCHIKQYLDGAPKLDHGPSFQKLADRVCKHHRNFDRVGF